jgi:hypothetical protein
LVRPPKESVAIFSPLDFPKSHNSGPARNMPHNF